MEKTGKKISHVTGVLARSVRIIIENILREGGALQEIRMRIGQPLTVMIDGEEQILPLKERAHIVLCAFAHVISSGIAGIVRIPVFICICKVYLSLRTLFHS